MSPKKTKLRACARWVLEQHGYDVEPITSAGVLPGARLRACKAGAEQKVVAVRTSLDREVGLTRQPDDSWTTVSKVDQVLVVVPATDQPDAAEVFGFAPDVLIGAFDAALAARSDKGELARKVPIFVALDTPDRGTLNPAAVGLKEKAEWRTVVSFASVRESEGTDRESTMAFLERVKREYAELQGVDVGHVSVEFRIKA